MGFKPRHIGCGLLAILFLLVAINGIQTVNSKTTKDNDLIFDDLQPLKTDDDILSSKLVSKRSINENTDTDQFTDEGEEEVEEGSHWLMQGFNRIKRSLSNIVGGSEGNTELKKKKKKNQNKQNQTKPLNHKKLNKNKEQKKEKKQNNLDPLLKKERKSLREKKKLLKKNEIFRPRRQDDYDIVSDDEDDNGGIESGSGSVPDMDEHEEGRLFRLKLSIEEIWRDQLADSRSEEYKKISDDLTVAFTELFEIIVPGNRVILNVVQIQKVGPTRIFVVIDMSLDQHISKQYLSSLIQNSIEENGRIGDYAAGLENFQFDIIAGDPEERNWEDVKEHETVEAETSSKRTTNLGTGRRGSTNTVSEVNYDETETISERNRGRNGHGTRNENGNEDGDEDYDEETFEEENNYDTNDGENETNNGNSESEYTGGDTNQTNEGVNNIEETDNREPDEGGNQVDDPLEEELYNGENPTEQPPPAEDETSDLRPHVQPEIRNNYDDNNFVDPEENGDLGSGEEGPSENENGRSGSEPNVNVGAGGIHSFEIHCEDNEELCNDGQQCFVSSNRCDGFNDCSDGTDESGCEQPTEEPFVEQETPKELECKPEELKCISSGVERCLQETELCDSFQDCDDNSDESESLCAAPSTEKALVCHSETEFACHDDLKCIPLERQCDKYQDCDDNSDESNCKEEEQPREVECAPEELKCTRSGADICIQERSLCDGVQDCDDNSDESESLCSTPAKPPSTEEKVSCNSETEFACHNGLLCIPLERQCDRVQDCDDNSDEINCEEEEPPRDVECAPEELKCTGSGVYKCVQETHLCDGVQDCDDNSDESESLCSTPAKPSAEETVLCDNEREFACHNGLLCIPLERQCDRRQDCPDNSDELNCAPHVPDEPRQDTPVQEVPTPEEPPSVDSCRGDDRVRCGDSDYFICGVQKCDGTPDCPSGEDEVGCDGEEEFACEGTDFRCDDRRCISDDKLCDGTEDCNDGTDENQCEPVATDATEDVCSWDQFRCTNGLCIANNLLCNRERDCPDGEDELNCPCTQDEFKCGDGKCIDINLRCNGAYNCADGSDEAECSVVKKTKQYYFCPNGQFTCGDRTCISILKRCDGKTNCPKDTADEDNCPCTKSEWQCDYGTCIPIEKLCDGNIDCPDDISDERNCANDCEPNEFSCDHNRCIQNNAVCDNISDCYDGTDESPENCQYSRDNCNLNEFQCNNGLCIHRDDRCNGVPDCIDYSDERNCTSCFIGAFHCHSLECIPESKRCDYIHDCHDLSDEINCKYTCPRNQFRCTNGVCLGEKYLCDGVRNCPDGSDEHPDSCDSYAQPSTEAPVSNVCQVDQWQCKNGVCIAKDFLCDSNIDCLDGSDEADCGDIETETECDDDQYFCDGECHSEATRCDGVENCLDGSDEFDCAEGQTDKPFCPELTCGSGECYARYQQCDSRYDCADGSDEINCVAPSCRPGQFRCNDGECIPESRRCDRQPNCRDRSDEANCPRERCQRDQWQCSDGACISNAGHCNGYPDCNDGSDERNCESEQDPACPPNMFRCENDPCIPMHLRCNGFVDCPNDISDELDCPSQPTPPPTQPPKFALKTYPNAQIIKERREVVFQCRDEGPLRAKVRWTRSNGRPLPPGSNDEKGRLEIPNIQMEHEGEYICEVVNYPKSIAGSSVAVSLKVEKYSIPTRPPVCGYEEATCANTECIPKAKVCDGNWDCADGSDEIRCSKLSRCEPNEFKCKNGKCVLKTWYCDGENDCGDLSDEQECGTPSPNSQCRSDEHQCRDGQCIPKAFVCDLQSDCRDNSDEQGCSAPVVITPPPSLIKLNPGDTFNITCRATGFPTPLITWRLNWGHIPDKCQATSVNGLGVLTCRNIEVRDSGAYSCEIINSVGSTIVNPDTILIVLDGDDVCPSGLFNAEATTIDDCIQCFCFGVSSQCKSADLFTYQLPPPVRSLNVVGVTLPDATVAPFNAQELISTNHGIQLRYSNIPINEQQPYYSLPSDYLNNQLKSYGGSIRYEIEFDGRGEPTTTPDIIIKGNRQVLKYTKPGGVSANSRNVVVAKLSPDGEWRTLEGRYATRQQIMLTLANVENILIKLQYVNAVQREIELLHIGMDSAGASDLGLGSAVLVEQCSCPEGYVGLSCENCAPGYVRQETGAWLGRCVRAREECPPGTYGDPNRGIPCSDCPCPLTNPENQFSQSCYVAPDNQVTCNNCPTGYTGRRCEACERGYEGNPLQYGGRCTPVRGPDCEPKGTERVTSSGECICKEYVTGIKCDQCKPHSFLLSSISPTGCINCFCMGVTNDCSSTSLRRDTVRLSYANDRGEALSVIADYEASNPITVEKSRSTIQNNEFKLDLSGRDNEVYYWSLPSRFIGNKITSYGGNLTYTLRYKSPPGGYRSRNNAPDVVIKSANDLIVLHYGRDDIATTSDAQTATVPILEEQWQRLDGKDINREHLLMALADVDAIYIKATYTTITEEAAIQQVLLDIASGVSQSSARAYEVEQCNCPEGHIGLSCEDCAPGYTRSETDGIYLSNCEKCNCNGHSDECNPDTGDCYNCRDNTEGDRCQYCQAGFAGNATIGSSYDCQVTSNRQCDNCDTRGGFCSDNVCKCKSNVVGVRCDQCARGTFNLDRNNPDGCNECVCSGLTTQCTAARFNREQIPISVMVDKFSLTSWDNADRVRGDIKTSIYNNEVSYDFSREEGNQKWYWNLPTRILGNQVLSYGGKLTITQKTNGFGRNGVDQNVILKGNGLTLVWDHGDFVEGSYSVPLYEQNWRTLDRSGTRVALRSELLSVLSNLESILVLASKYSETESAYISDITLDTAVNHETGQNVAPNIELCTCPQGYAGTSCETCENLHYRDVNDQRFGNLGVCTPCPCQSRNTEHCAIDSGNRVKCFCRPGYYGEACETTEPPQKENENLTPNITITISQPSLRIVEVGETVRITCTGRHVNQIPITIRWIKLGGEFSPRAYERYGTLYITNTQEDDSGVYECRAQTGREVATERVTITIGVQSPPVVTFNPLYIDEEENNPAEVRCIVTGSPRPSIEWEKLNGQISTDVVIDGGLLRFNSLRISDEGDYRCFASNPVGQDDQILHVYVRAAPVVTDRPYVVEIIPDRYDGPLGQEVVLQCGNSETANIIWSKDGERNLPSNIYIYRNILRIQNAQVYDSGVYTCSLVTTGSPQQAHSVVNIQSTATQPVITRLPESHIIVQGTDYSLVCQAVGSPTPTVKWTMHHESFRPNAQQIGNTLHIYNAQLSNRGIYSCVATNDGGTDESSIRIDIEAREPPRIELHPTEPQVIRVTEPAMLSCRAIAGQPTPSVKWTRKDNQPISSRFIENYEGTITLENAQLEDAGEYVCRADNIAGSVTLSTTIQVHQPPVLNLEPNESVIRLTEGDELKITCFANGIPRPVTAWETPGRTPFDLSAPRSLDSAEATLNILQVSRSDAGYYTCSARNSAGSETRYVEVQVQERRGDIPGGDPSNNERSTQRPTQRPTPRPRPPVYPPVTQAPSTLKPYTIVVGDRSTLSCELEGIDPNTKTYWQRSDGQQLPYHAYIRGGDLVIERTTLEAAGIYECIIDSQYQDPFPIIRAQIIVTEPPKIVFHPPMPMVVQSGDNVNITCETSGVRPIQAFWHGRDNQPLPRSRSVYTRGNILEFVSITQDDAGTYYCTAENRDGRTTKAAEVIVNPNKVIENNPQPNQVQQVDEGTTVSLDCNMPENRYGRVEWRRENVEIPRSATFDGNRLILHNIRQQDAGIYTCEIYLSSGRTARHFVNVVVNRNPAIPYLKLDPPASYLKPGDSFEVECIALGGPGSVIWEAEDGSRLPYNFRQIDNRLIMNDVQLQNQGRYVCRCDADGQLYTSEYELKIEVPEIREPLQPKVEFADVGSNIVLKCNTGNPARFLWSRPTGALPEGQDYTNNELRLTDVQAKDAGTYICTATHSGQTIEIPTILVVTNAIPFFPQAPKSYMTFPTLEDAYMRFNFEITFRPQKGDGLILYNGERRGAGDYIALSLHDGYPEFRFDFGNQPVTLRAVKPISLGDWHTIKVNRIRKDGFMMVDDQSAVTIPSNIRSAGLDLIENLYIGGVPRFEDIPDSAVAIKTGFVGCVSRLILRDREVQLNKESLFVEGTTSCEPCADDPCANNGVCLEAHTNNGYSCVCRKGFTGKDCAFEGDSCRQGICGSGRCLDTDFGLQCLCPMNRTGSRCQLTENLEVENLSFKDGSYAAYKTPKSNKLNIKFRVRADNLEDSVLLYAADSESSTGDFAAVVIKDKHVEFRFMTGGRVEPAIVRSTKALELNKWTDIAVGRRLGEGFLQINNEPQVTGKLVGPSRNMYLKTHLYIGGYDKTLALNSGVGATKGFEGCITKLEISGLPVNMIHDALEAVNVQTCGEKEIETNEVNLNCRAGFGGKDCQIVTDVCQAQNPCENGAVCRSTGLDYTCECPLGFAGDVCQNWITIEHAAHFSGNGYIELNSSTISTGSRQKVTGVAILFSATQPDGLICWYGQNKGETYNGQDFISLALVNGYLEYSFRLNGEESLITYPHQRFDNGERNVAIIKREGNQASLEINSLTLTGESRPTDKKEAFIPGHLFLGGAPDLANFTGNRYTTGFHGCIHIVEPIEGGSINLSRNAISALNVDQCPDEEEAEIDLGTDPPLA